MKITRGMIAKMLKQSGRTQKWLDREVKVMHRKEVLWFLGKGKNPYMEIRKNAKPCK